MTKWKGEKEKKKRKDVHVLSVFNDSFPLTGFFCRVLDKLELCSIRCFSSILTILLFVQSVFCKLAKYEKFKTE